MKEQRNQNAKSNNKFWTKGVALLLAVTVVATTLGVNVWNRAASYNNVSSANSQGPDLSAGSSFAEVFTANESIYETLESISFKYHTSATTFNYTVSVYGNLGSTGSNPDSGNLVYQTSSAQSGTSDVVTTYTFPSLAGFYMEVGEVFSVVIYIRSGAGYFYYGTTTNTSVGYVKSASASGWDTGYSGIIQANATSVDVSAIKSALAFSFGSTQASYAVDDTISLSPQMTASKNKRTIKYTVSNLSVIQAIAGDGTSEALSSGEVTVSAYLYSEYENTNLLAEKTLYIFDPDDITVTATYGADEPTVVVNPSWAESALTKNTDYTVSTPTYNENTGKWSVTVAGAGDYFGFSITKSYSLNAKDITTVDDAVNADNYTVDANTLTVTGNVSGLTQDVDYTATTTTPTLSGTNLIYTITVTGIGNYTSNKDITKTVDTTSGDISQIFKVKLDPTSVSYNGSTHTVTPSFFYANGASTTTSNYSIAQSSRTAVGTATVTITGSSPYSGTIETTFSIKQNNILNNYVDSTSSLASGNVCITLSASDSAVSTGSDNEFYYNANGVKPTVTAQVANGSNWTTMTEGTDYKIVSYSGHTGTGTATVTISGMGNFTGTKTISYTIKNSFTADLVVTVEDTVVRASNGQYVLSESNYSPEYTGTEIKPTVTDVKLGDTSLTADEDYTVEYDNNTNANEDTDSVTGRAYIKIVGKGSYSTYNVPIYFTIKKKTLSNAVTLSITDRDQTYTGDEIKPAYTLTSRMVNYSSASFTKDQDYTEVYTKNTDVGTATLTLTGNGNFTGSVSQTFTISAIKMVKHNTETSGTTVGITFTNGSTYEYSGVAQEPAYTVQYYVDGTAAGTLTKGTDFTAKFSNNTNVGEATLKITAIEGTNFSGSISETFSISERSFASIKPYITLTATQTYQGTRSGSDTDPYKFVTDYAAGYTGSIQSFSVRVLDALDTGDKMLTQGTDYEISKLEANNKNTGDAYVTLTGKGNYAGTSAELHYTIVGVSIGDGTTVVTPGETYYYPANGNTSNAVYVTYAIPEYYTTDHNNYYCLDMLESSKQAQFKLYSRGTLLTYGTDYTISVTGNAITQMMSQNGGMTNTAAIEDLKVASGNWKVAEVTASGNYEGSFFIAYQVGTELTDKNTGGNTNIRDLASTVSYGSAPTGISVFYSKTSSDAGNALTKDIDYTLSYYYYNDETLGAKINESALNTVDAGNTIKVFATAIASNGEYYQADDTEISGTYKVVPFTGGISATDTTALTYTGNDITINPTVTATVNDSTVTLTKDVDYTLSATSVGPDVGTYAITVTPIGNFEGSDAVTLTYSVGKKPISDDSISVTIGKASLVAVGTEVTPTVTVTDTEAGYTLVKDTDYSISFANNTAIGTASVTITALEDAVSYTGTRTKTFEVTATELTSGNTEISGIDESYNYQGWAWTPTVSVVYTGGSSDVELTENTDYTVTYTNNRDPGKATVTIKGMGAYAGTITKTFEIIGNLTNTVLFEVNNNSAKFMLLNDGTVSLESGSITITRKYYNSESEFSGGTPGGAATTLLSQGNEFRLSMPTGTSPSVNATVYISGIASKYYTGDRPINNVTIAGQLSDDTKFATVSFINTVGNDSDGVPYYKYTGQDPLQILTTINGNTLTQGTNADDSKDYYLDYATETAMNAGEHTVTLRATTGSSAYLSGSPSFTYYVKYDFDAATVTIDQKSYKYNGQVQKPTVAVKIGDEDITTYTTNTITETKAAGTYEVTVSPNTSTYGKYIYGDSTYTFTYSIGQMNLSTVADLKLNTTTATYTGYPITPTFTLEPKSGYTDYTVNADDYDIDWRNNVNAGTATVVLTGKGDYTGTLTATFTIEKKNISDTTAITADAAAATYPGDNYVAESEITMTYAPGNNLDAWELTKGTDYTLDFGTATGSSYGNLSESTSEGTATITGTGNFEGTRTVTFDVVLKDLSDGTARVANMSKVYDGAAVDLSALAPTVTCTTNGNTITLSKDTDYKLSSSGSIGAAIGTYTVNVTGTNTHYTGETTFTYSITEDDISDTGNFSVLFYNNGKTSTECAMDWEDGKTEYKPEIIVLPTDGTEDNRLTEGTDYTVGWLNYTDAAAADDETAPPTVVVKGINNYTGTVKLYYAIGQSIDAAAVTANPSAFTYDGEAHEPTSVTVVMSGDTLDEGTHYAIGKKTDSSGNEVTSSVDAGTYYLTINGKTDAGYYGTTQAKYTIEPKTINWNKMKVYFSDSILTWESDGWHAGYTGSAVKPYVVVENRDGTTPDTASGVPTYPTLTYGSDYTVTYTNNIDVTASASKRAVATVVPIGNYKGESYTYASTDKNTDLRFFIDSTDMSGYYVVLGSTSEEYTGKAIQPEVYVYTDSSMTTRVSASDYKVTYSNNTNAGTAKATVTGTGNYTGSISKEFTITAKLTASNVKIADQFYTGAALTPAPTVTAGGNTLTPYDATKKTGDYTVSYKNNVEVGTATATITLTDSAKEKGYYYPDEVDATFTISKDANMLTAEVNIAKEYTYTGSEIKPLGTNGNGKITVKANGQTQSVEAINVTYTRGTNTAAATDFTNITKRTTGNVAQGSSVTATTSTPINYKITVTIGGEKIVVKENTATGAKNSEKNFYYNIVPKSINAISTLEVTSEVTYTGSALEPTAVVSDNGKALTKGTDYTLTYSNNREPSVGTATITGIGNYKDTAVKNFYIKVPDVTGLTTTNKTTNSIALSWNENNSVSGYKVYSADGKTLYGETTGNTFTKSNLNAGTTYTFGVVPYVTKTDGSKVYGSMSKLGSASTNNNNNGSTTTTLARPTLKAKVTKAGNVRLTLPSTSDSSITYRVYRSTTKRGGYKHIATPKAGTTKYYDKTVKPNRTYYYRIRAVKSNGTTLAVSKYSKAVKAKTK